MLNRTAFFVLMLMVVTVSKAQTVKVEGRVYDPQNPNFRIEHLMVISQKSNKGVFSDVENRFSISISKEDTLLISASGYERKKVCLKDSSFRETYNLMIPLKKLSVELKGFTIDRQRDLQAIEKDISKLGYNPNDFRIHGAEAWMSPIDALYSEFSKRERAKRQVAEWMNRDNRNALLKELFRYYERAGLMQLDEEQYDDFILFLNFTDQQLQAFSQYDLAVYVRQRYFAFKGDWRH